MQDHDAAAHAAEEVPLSASEVMFDLAPAAMWLEDLSTLKIHFDALRAEGVTSLRDYLQGHDARIKDCAACLKMLKANRRSLQLFEADDLPHLVGNLDKIFRDEMLVSLVDELVQLWDGSRETSRSWVGFTLTGRRLDLQIRGVLLPGSERSWSQYLISTEDVTLQKAALRQAAASEAYARDLFELAPAALSLEDLSGLKALFETWRARGVTSLRAYLQEDHTRIKACIDLIRCVKSNVKSLKLYEATHIDQFDKSIFCADALDVYIDELEQLWNHSCSSTKSVNFTLAGKRLLIQLDGVMLPGYEDNWERYIVSTQDITARENALKQLALSEAYAVELFDHSPVSLWVCDLSDLKKSLDRQKDATHRLLQRRQFLLRSTLSRVKVLDVSSHTLHLLKAPDKSTVIRNWHQVFGHQALDALFEQLLELWHGEPLPRQELQIRAIDGEDLHVHAQISILPGSEADWSRVLMALTDITARKRAEADLEFLGKHDALTKLYSRSFYMKEMMRLERSGPYPISVIVADLNGLKPTNDHLGHAAGDELLRRLGEILTEAVHPPCHAARIGGDEFVILMPATEEHAADLMMVAVKGLIEASNRRYAGPPVSVSFGVATGRAGEGIEAIVKQADARMYEAKRLHYAEQPTNRRSVRRMKGENPPCAARA